MSDGKVVPFRKPEPAEPDDDGDLLFTVHIYYLPGHGDEYTIYAEQEGTENTGMVDMPRLAETLYMCAMKAHQEVFETTGDNDHDISAAIRIANSSFVSVRWHDDDFTTPQQLRWLRRRLDQAYYSLDERPSIGRMIYRLRTTARRLINKIYGRPT